MKWRNQLLALFCLLVFLAFGVFYFETWVVQKPFGIILFVGEGLDPARLAAARLYAAGADTPLNLDALKSAALLKNYSSDYATPDQAAAATAFATGAKVKNGTVGMAADGKRLTNLFELARESGRMTGLVSDARLTDPTAAGFYAHRNSIEERQEFARELVENGQLDVVLGGGAADFLPLSRGGVRAEESDLLTQLQDSGYDVIQTVEELEEVPRWRRAKLFGLFAEGALAFADDDARRATQPTLSDMVRRSIELLQFNRGGYLLVVDAGLMRAAAQQNNAERTLLQTIELDRAVSVALEYAGGKSLVLVCGDVSVGGMNLSGFARRDASGPAWLERTADAAPLLTWASGPHAPHAVDPSEATPAEPARDAPNDPIPASSEPPQDLATIYAANALNTTSDVLALGAGLGADALHGVIENTAIFDIVQDNL